MGLSFNAVSDRYVQTMGIALIAGRDFDDRDAAAAPKVAIVSESFARVYFGGANALGRTFQTDVAPGVQRPTYTIVGLARDAKYNDLRQPFAPEFYSLRSRIRNTRSGRLIWSSGRRSLSK